MKARYLALILAPLFSAAALAASYTGPGASRSLRWPLPTTLPMTLRWCCKAS